MSSYKIHLKKLLEQGKAYPCFCTKEDLDKKREQAETAKKTYTYDRTCLNLSDQEIHKRIEKDIPYSIRLKIEPQPLGFTDLIRGDIQFKKFPFNDFIIFRPDGMPIYNFACVCDDADMKITHVLRGDDHISNTPRQLLIYTALDLEPPLFGHLPMILGSDGSRLSKRHGATSIQQYREQGYLPQTLINFLAKLGWSFDDTQEVFSLEELIKKFSLDKVSSNPAVFNTKKLDWLNSEYIRQLSTEEKYNLSRPFMIKSGLITEEEYTSKKDLIFSIINLAGDRIKTFSQLTGFAEYILDDVKEYEEKGYQKFIKQDYITSIFQKISDNLRDLKDFTKPDLEGMFMSIVEDSGISTKKIMQAVRVALTGSTESPDLAGLILLLGKEPVMKRLNRIIEREA